MSTDPVDRPGDEPADGPDDVVRIPRETVDEILSRVVGPSVLAEHAADHAEVLSRISKIGVSQDGTITVHAGDESVRARLRDMDLKDWATVLGALGAALGGLGGAVGGVTAAVRSGTPPPEPPIEVTMEVTDVFDRSAHLLINENYSDGRPEVDLVISEMERLGLEDQFLEILQAEWEADPLATSLDEDLRGYLQEATEAGAAPAEVDRTLREMVHERARQLGLA